jgi:hypothetical protein
MSFFMRSLRRTVPLIGTLLISAVPVHAGTLGECPNRGDRCYLNTNGVPGYQEGQDRYFSGGETDARRDCFKRGGQYISNLSGPDYCTK